MEKDIGSRKDRKRRKVNRNDYSPLTNIKFYYLHLCLFYFEIRHNFLFLKKGLRIDGGLTSIDLCVCFSPFSTSLKI